MKTNLLTDFIQDIADGKFASEYGKHKAQEILHEWNRSEMDIGIQDIANDIVNEAVAMDKAKAEKRDHGINNVARHKDVQKLEKRVNVLESYIKLIGKEFKYYEESNLFVVRDTKPLTDVEIAELESTPLEEATHGY